MSGAATPPDAPSMPPLAARPLAWSWRAAAHGAVLALPAVVAALVEPDAALPLALGVLPAAAFGLRGPRRQRALTLLVGGVAGVAILLGSLVAPVPALAVLVILALCVVVAVLVADPTRRLAPVLLVLGLPLVGVGLSESPAIGLATAVLMLLGSVYAWLVSLIWPSREAPPRPPTRAVPRALMLVYGLQIGVAGALGAGLGFALGVDHPGWACAAALLVSRPQARVLGARSAGRAVSVLLGALAACGLAALHPPGALLGGVALVLLVGASGTAGSRWYVMPFFSTTLVLSMLIGDETATAGHWFVERVLLTLLGVALALGAALLANPVKSRLAARDATAVSRPLR